jgi:pimeloyl-ACP methyl ester carboxylesterase
MFTMDTGMTSLSGISPFLRTHVTRHLHAGGFGFHHLHAGSGRPLILVHGGGTWLYSYRHVMGPLSRVFSVYALDMPGYGYTTMPDAIVPMDLGTMTSALKDFMTALGLSSASFVGHSWGGGWVLAFALAYPAMVDRLVLMDSSGLDVPDVMEWELLKVPVLGEILLRILTPGMVQRRLMKSFHDPSLVDSAMAREVYLPLKTSANRKAQAAISRNLSWKSVEAGLPALTHQAMLIWGAQDRYLDVSLAGRFSQSLPGLRLEIIDGCGHCPHEEKPHRVVALVEGFLRSP